MTAILTLRFNAELGQHYEEQITRFFAELPSTDASFILNIPQLQTDMVAVFTKLNEAIPAHINAVILQSWGVEGTVAQSDASNSPADTSACLLASCSAMIKKLPDHVVKLEVNGFNLPRGYYGEAPQLIELFKVFFGGHPSLTHIRFSDCQLNMDGRLNAMILALKALKSQGNGLAIQFIGLEHNNLHACSESALASFAKHLAALFPPDEDRSTLEVDVSFNLDYQLNTSSGFIKFIYGLLYQHVNVIFDGDFYALSKRHMPAIIGSKAMSSEFIDFILELCPEHAKLDLTDKYNSNNVYSILDAIALLDRLSQRQFGVNCAGVKGTVTIEPLFARIHQCLSSGEPIVDLCNLIQPVAIYQANTVMAVLSCVVEHHQKRVMIEPAYQAMYLLKHLHDHISRQTQATALSLSRGLCWPFVSSNVIESVSALFKLFHHQEIRALGVVALALMDAPSCSTSDKVIAPHSLESVLLHLHTLEPTLIFRYPALGCLLHRVWENPRRVSGLIQSQGVMPRMLAIEPPEEESSCNDAGPDLVLGT